MKAVGEIIKITNENNDLLIEALNGLLNNRVFLVKSMEKYPLEITFANYRFILSEEVELLELTQVLQNKLESFRQKMVKHKLSFCTHCGVYMYRCGTCDNNSCNGGYGMINENPCKDCMEAHRLSSIDNNKFHRLIEYLFYKIRRIKLHVNNLIFNIKDYMGMIK